jgi:hypothetical protein
LLSQSNTSDAMSSPDANEKDYQQTTTEQRPVSIIIIHIPLLD